MAMQLTEREARTIILARKYAKVQNISRPIIIVSLIALFIAATEGIVDVYFFRSLTVMIAVMMVVKSFDKFPSYNDLLALLEKKVSESEDAIESLAELNSII